MDEEQELISASSKSETYKGITFNKSVSKTVYLDKKEPGSYRNWCLFACIFQLLIICFYTVVNNTMAPVIYGLGFMEKEPPRFECLNDSDGTWRECSRDEICDRNIPKDHYRPVKDDDEYFDNWVEKYDMLCEPKYKVGLLGSMYFIGVLVSMTFVGYLADLYGRKIPFIVSLVLQSIALLGFMLADDLYQAYFFEFLLGFTFAGRVVVGLNYILEYNQPKWYDQIVYWVLVFENINTILMTVWYQFVDRGWFLLQLIMVILTVLITIYFLVIVPESPKWKYGQKMFQDARQILTKVAQFNRLPQQRISRIQNSHFDIEVLQNNLEQFPDNVSIKSDISQRLCLISKKQFYINIAIMTILWTFCSFSTYMLQFMNKYFEGSIYLNYYLDGAAGIIGNTVGIFILKCAKIRWSYTISIVNVLLGAIALLCFQQGYWSVNWIGVFLPQKSPFPEDSEDERQYYLRYVIPIVVFYVKVFLGMSFQITYRISFGENKIFPFYSRATAITFCNFVARSVTVTSSLAAELPKPWPASLLIGFTVISLITTFFLPTYSEEIEFDEKENKILNEGIQKQE